MVEPAVRAPVPHRTAPRELPPPFYPSMDQRSTPTSATSSTFAPPPFHQQVPPFSHGHHHSTNNLVFGGYPDSSSTSPAPGPGGYMHFGHQGPEGSGFPPGQFVPFDMAHPPFGANGQPRAMIPPSHMAAGAHFHGYPGHEPRFIPTEYMGYPQTLPLPRNDFPHHNGSTPGSHSPSSQTSHHIHEPAKNGATSSEGLPASVPVPAEPSTPPPEVHQLPVQAAVFPEPPPVDSTLKAWLQSQFNNPNFADYVLKISVSPEPLSLMMHSVISARSPFLFTLLKTGKRTTTPTSPLPVLELKLNEPFIDNHVISTVLEYLYTDYLPHLGRFASSLPPFDINSGEPSIAAQEGIKFALGIALTGSILRLPDVEQHGVEMIKTALRPDTVGLALTTAIPHSPNTAFLADHFRTPLLRLLTAYIVNTIPPAFSLDQTAPPLPMMSRLPEVKTHRPAASDARLSRIQFGEVPHDTSNLLTREFSSILLSLPFSALELLLDTLGRQHIQDPSRLDSLFNDIVQERETRRKHVLASKKKFSSDEDSPRWREVHWEEGVGTVGGKPVLRRRWLLSQ